ncbi:ecotin family protein [Chitinilyticum litopenaei]|uniref:ecotin family protein n=1 Tax=Chitinilyticum litopenaei TaxID=1121276 RepID=UPI0003FF3576|nr:ecotin family protein [Chitinilyticum litopenaei]
MTPTRTLLPLLALSMLGAGPALAGDALKPFPPAQAGFERKVIRLPEVANPELYRVQLIPGKVVKADCNTRGLRASISEVTVQGWGYTYWTVGPIQPGPSTLMACPEPASDRFVPVHHEQLIRYNPKLPLVVYIPQGSELRYKVWSAPESAATAHSE